MRARVVRPVFPCMVRVLLVIRGEFEYEKRERDES